MGGVSSIGYSYNDHFAVDFETVSSDPITTFQVKGEESYNLDDRLSFVNSGYVQKPPILDNVIDYDGNVSTNLDNEKFTSFEVGGEYRSELVQSKVVTTILNGMIETLPNLSKLDKVTQVIQTSFI